MLEAFCILGHGCRISFCTLPSHVIYHAPLVASLRVTLVQISSSRSGWRSRRLSSLTPHQLRPSQRSQGIICGIFGGVLLSCFHYNVASFRSGRVSNFIPIISFYSLLAHLYSQVCLRSFRRFSLSKSVDEWFSLRTQGTQRCHRARQGKSVHASRISLVLYDACDGLVSCEILSNLLYRTISYRCCTHERVILSISSRGTYYYNIYQLLWAGTSEGLGIRWDRM